MALIPLTAQQDISERARKLHERKLLLDKAKVLHEADLETEFTFGARMASERFVSFFPLPSQ